MGQDRTRVRRRKDVPLKKGVQTGVRQNVSIVARNVLRLKPRARVIPDLSDYFCGYSESPSRLCSGFLFLITFFVISLWHSSVVS